MLSLSHDGHRYDVDSENVRSLCNLFSTSDVGGFVLGSADADFEAQGLI